MYDANSTVLTPVSSVPKLRDRFAHHVSLVLSPPIAMMAAAFLTHGSVEAAGGWWAPFVFCAGAIFVPMALLVYWVRRGVISDLDVGRREQRTRPFAAALIGATAGAAALWLLEAPSPLVRFALAYVLVTAVLFLVSLRWKISVHGAAIASLSVVLSQQWGMRAELAVLLVVLVAWARVRLERHTVAQTVAGALLGTAAYLLV
ncbi:MAG: hypothetical protein RL885_29970 [Planctomycetota bacterium]